MNECPICHRHLWAGEGRDIEKDGVQYREIKLYCRTRGCPNNNGEPVKIDEVETDGNNE